MRYIALCPQLREEMCDAISGMKNICLDGDKWMFTQNQDLVCGINESGVLVLLANWKLSFCKDLYPRIFLLTSFLIIGLFFLAF
jgi:hypothetical protein